MVPIDLLNAEFHKPSIYLKKKAAVSVIRSKAKYNKMRYTFILLLLSYLFNQETLC